MELSQTNIETNISIEMICMIAGQIKRMCFLGVSEKGAAYMCMKLDAAMHNPWNWSGGTNVLPTSL